MLIGYIRVSTAEQNLDLQRDALLAAGVELDRIYEDVGSGRKDDRPGLKECMRALREGDTLVVWKLDRLGRDLKHLIITVEDLTKRGIGFKVLEGHGSSIDTTGADGKLIFRIFCALAEYERERLVERTKAGLKAARARGRLGGRPRKMSREKLRMAMAAMADPEAKPKEVAKSLGITTATLYAYVNGDGTVKEEGAKILSSTGG